jgi:hypothetical protein
MTQIVPREWEEAEPSGDGGMGQVKATARNEEAEHHERQALQRENEAVAVRIWDEARALGGIEQPLLEVIKQQWELIQA